MTILTDRFVRALDYARIAHAGQVRKGSGIPYMCHLLGVTSLVLAHEGTEDQAIAGLLHDVLEDCGADHEPVIRAKFGDAVASIVLDCTDGTAESKAKHVEPEAKRRNWMDRKLAHLEHVRNEPDATLLVSACDKLHNAGAIVDDLEDPEVGITVFDRFTATREQTLGYYQSLSEIFTERKAPVARAFNAIVARMHALAGIELRAPLSEHEVSSSAESEPPHSSSPPSTPRNWRSREEELKIAEQYARNQQSWIGTERHPEDERR